LRLEGGLRWSIYSIVAVLFATGVAWWLLDERAGPARHYLIATHGLAAMAFLVALGATFTLHVREGWRRRLNRVSGAVVLTIAGVLMLTAFGLYYFGSDALRSCTSDLHIIIGLALPLLLAVHIVLGRRGRKLNASLEDEM
jgi:drug/metabolite transporter (DMT)-like permease